MKRNLFLSSLALPVLSLSAQEQRPNIIILNIDDMGYADPMCFGGDYAETPNIDKLAEEGQRFTQFYTACPISSPSRVGLTTGMYPSRWGINTFLQDRVNNAKNEQNDFLSSRAPSMARALHESGYATGHFGKWHMGGGRDVNDAPSIATYGFDEFASTWESPNPDPNLTSTNWIWAPTDNVKRWDRTAYFVDKTLDFLSRHKGEPCFVNLWPDDVHTPWVYENDEATQRESSESFAIVLKELDVQIGRLMQGLKDLGIDDNTIVIFTSDNGPAPAFDGHRTHSFRGQKGTLYEGGIRMPFIIRWPGKVPAGTTNDKTVIGTVDLFPSLCRIAQVPIPTNYPLDGQDMSEVLLGEKQPERATPLFWEFGKTKSDRVSPHIAVRDGKWKLLVNADGSMTELYDMDSDALEQYNVAMSHPDVVNVLKPKAINWFNEAFRQYANNVIRVASDGDEAASGASWNEPTTISHAIELVSQEPGSQIWMKGGTYLVESSINVDKVAFYGGFAGTEQQLSQRDWMKNETIIDGGGKVSPLRNQSLDATVSTVVDGLIIQNGVNQTGANGNGNGGGAILTNGAVVRNCIFRNNRTQNGKNGAALHCHLGQVTIENSLFVDNISSGNGGAIQVGGGVTANVVNCTFIDNTANGPGGAFGLGAANSNINIYNTLAWHNTGKGTMSSYGQNTDVNGGGVVVSKYSAIESVSTKFTDGDDIAHITLSEQKTPLLEEGTYKPQENSPCVDSGNANLLTGLDKDLAGNRRLSGKNIDMGAYEFDNGEPVAKPNAIHVSTDGDALLDGNSWEEATTLDHALSLADSYAQGCVIWMKEGLYIINAPIHPDKMEIYGGFSGSETDSAERDWASHATILDGGNKVSVVRNSNLDAAVSTVLDGLTIQNGVNQTGANGNGNGGGAILTNGAVVRNCIFRNNRTQNGKNGAALHCHLGQVRVENSLFYDNISTGNGGAVQVGGGVTATFINCTMAGNKAAGPGGAFGLGTDSSNLNVYNTLAWHNTGNDQMSSYGQNANLNGGGKVVSKYSAIESVSTKFIDGDDEGHIILSEEYNPRLDESTYMLQEDSPCIDAGDDNFAAVSVRDLAGNDRIQGSHVDIGAYESSVATAVSTANEHKCQVTWDGGVIFIRGALKNSAVRIYSAAGTLLCKKTVDSFLTTITFKHNGVCLAVIGNMTHKLVLH